MLKSWSFNLSVYYLLLHFNLFFHTHKAALQQKLAAVSHPVTVAHLVFIYYIDNNKISLLFNEFVRPFISPHFHATIIYNENYIIFQPLVQYVSKNTGMPYTLEGLYSVLDPLFCEVSVDIFNLYLFNTQHLFMPPGRNIKQCLHPLSVHSCLFLSTFVYYFLQLKYLMVIK